MLPAVQLDDQLFLRAAQISDVAFDWELTTKLELAELSSPQAPPQLCLERCLLAPEVARMLMQKLFLPQ